MTVHGWFLMNTCLTLALSLATWRYYRILNAPRKEVPRPARDFHSA
jgi:hypothetical protein